MSGPPPGLRDHLALALVPGLGPKLTRAVLDHFGSPAAVLAASAAQLEAVPMVGATLARRFADAFRTVDVAAEWAKIDAHRVRVVLADDEEYPPRLSAIPDPPTLLYLRGELTAADANAVAIVGSRACTAYGQRVAERIAAGLAAAGWTVVSGLAAASTGRPTAARSPPAGGRWRSWPAGCRASIRRSTPTWPSGSRGRGHSSPRRR